MGNSFIEAMAADLPVIATQEGGIADFLFDAERNPESPATGWAVDADSPGQIARAVEIILSNPEKTEVTLARAHALVRETYTWEKVVAEMKTLFASL
jgi:glycosyltransferase involved in cell wall biosynthesis